MNHSPAFIIWWKEFRAALPLWGVALVAVILPTTVGARVLGFSPLELHIFAFAIGTFAFVSGTFAREFQDKTMLAQMLLPQGHFILIFRKILVTLVLQLILTVAYFFTLESDEWGSTSKLWSFVISINAVALAGGCFWGLVTKQTLGTTVISFAFAFFPALIGQGVVNLLKLDLQPYLGDRTGETILLGGGAIYTIGCVAGAIVYWNRFQLKSDAPTNFGLGAMLLSRFTRKTRYVKQAGWAVLIRKELGLQRSCFGVAAIMVGAAVLFSIVDAQLSAAIQTAADASAKRQLSDTLEFLQVFGPGMNVALAGLIPLMAGALAFAAEKHIGNRAWQLTEPVSAARQWMTKIGTATATSLGLGILLPTSIATAYAALLHDGLPMSWLRMDEMPTVILTHLMALYVTAWCATWSSTTISGIMRGVLVFVMIVPMHHYMTEALTTRYWDSAKGFYVLVHYPDWRWAVLAMIAGTLVYTFRNHRQIMSGQRYPLFQGATLVVVTVVVMVFDAWIQ